MSVQYPPAAQVERALVPAGDSRTAGLLRRLLVSAGSPAITLELPAGERVAIRHQDPKATFRLADHGALLRLLADPQMQFGELYSSGRLELVQGELCAALEEMFRAARRVGTSGRFDAGELLRALAPRRRNSLARARRHVHAHYDLGNEFYALWLDPSMAYTCAYFETPAATLAEAQRAKFEHVCRKLRLRPGDEVIEAGCGWGGFALHAARHHGVTVRAFNVSREQLVWARAAAVREGLEGRVEFIEDDYRNIRGQCDAFVSIGMLEHVGQDQYEALGRLVARVLRTDGGGLIHSIGRNVAYPINPWILRHIFPGASIPTLREMMRLFEPSGFTVHDVENLGRHYARTLAAWRAGFEGNVERVRALFDERFVRCWRLYLAGSEAAFRCGDMQLFQVLFAPPDSARIPPTRADLYAPGG